jgi:hypothetical protein
VKRRVAVGRGTSSLARSGPRLAKCTTETVSKGDFRIPAPLTVRGLLEQRRFRIRGRRCKKLEAHDQEAILGETPQPKGVLNMEALGSGTHKQGNRQEARGVGWNHRDSSVSTSEQTWRAKWPHVDSNVVRESEEGRFTMIRPGIKSVSLHL